MRLLLLLLLLQQLSAGITAQSADELDDVVAVAEGDGTAVVSSASGFNYMVVASKELRLGSNYTVGVSLRGGGGLKSVTASIRTLGIRDNFENVSTSSARGFGEGNVQSTELRMLLPYEAERYDTSGKYQLEVNIEDFSGRKFTNSSEIRVSEPTVLTLIQTDKAVYQPGQTVKYRVLTVDAAFKPMLLDTEVVIKDGSDNMVYRRSHAAAGPVPQTADATVLEGQLPLSSLPNEGSWKLEASTSFGKRSKSFQVYKYALPKFSLEVQKPEFVHFNDDNFTVTASVRYTFAKAVEGTFKVKLGPYNPCRSCKPRYDLQQEFEVPAEDEETEFTFNLTAWRDQLQSLPGWRSGIQSFGARAEVVFVEKFTGVNKSEAVSFRIYSKKYSVDISTDTPFFLPGFTVPLAVKLERPDGEPFTESSDSNVTVTISYERRGKPESRRVYSGGVTAAAAGTGVTVMAIVPAAADFSTIRFEASLDDDDDTDSVSVVPYMAVTDDYVMADIVNEGDKMKMQLNRSPGIEFTYIATVARSQLQSWQQVAMESSDLRMDWLGSDCSDCDNLLPTANVLLLGVTAGGEIVAADVEQDMRSLLGNVSVTSNLTDNTGMPKDFASLTIRAQQDSYVFLSGIDHSVNLIATGQDILRSSLTQNVGVTYSRWRPRPTSVNAGQLLRDNNLLLLSDGFYFQETPSSGLFPFGMHDTQRLKFRSRMAGAEMRLSSADAAPSPGAGGNSGEESGMRDFFPETMLWSMVKTNASGVAETTVQLPDTMTSWDISAFGVRYQGPVQTMEEPTQLVTRSQFFLQPQLPATVVRGERFILKVVAMNFAVAPGSANVSLELNNSEFSAKPLGGGDTWTSDDAVGVSIPEGGGDGSVGMATFELVPRSVGEMTLVLRGFLTVKRFTSTSVYSDNMTKPLRVVPEGQTVRRTKALLLSLNGSRSEQAKVEFPTSSGRLVPGSEVLSYHLLGDVLGPAMENLEQLVRMPSGCGEQNLVHFAPAVGVAEYLTTVGRTDEPAMRKAERAMQTGYQQQLAFRRRDGGYSAFGDKDAAGSVWLTAFVLGVYARASKFLPVDAATLSGSSLAFVLRHQQRNGAFAEPPGARVFDSRLQGGAADSSIAMTASVCASLADVSKAATSRPELRTTLMKERLDLAGAVAKCLRLLASLPADEEAKLDALDLAVSVFALELAAANRLTVGVASGLEDARLRLGRRLREAAVDENDRRFWQLTTSWGSARGSVEATAYALMSGVLADAEPDLRVLRWLLDQQADNGGFGTTQATVVGVRALTTFAASVGVSRQSSGVAANVTVAVGESQSEFFVDDNSRWLLQSRVVARGAAAAANTNVVVAARGSGLLLLTVAWQYNLRDADDLQLLDSWRNSRGLGLRLGENKLAPPAVGGFGFEVCATANLTEGMYILVVSNPSGFSPADQSQPNSVPGLQRVEAGDKEVVFYFTSLSEPVCVQARWQRSLAVLNASPQRVTLRKYYSEEDSLTVVYTAPELRGVTRCGACPDCPGCE